MRLKGFDMPRPQPVPMLCIYRIKKDENSSNLAHQSPDVISIWRPMEALNEKMEFLKTETVRMSFEK